MPKKDFATRKFNGHVYRLEHVTDTKKNAQNWKKALQKSGYKSRIAKYRNGYLIYGRK